MEIAISRDIRKYKTKDVGNFSFKVHLWFLKCREKVLMK